MSGSIDNGGDNLGIINSGTLKAENLIVVLQQAEKAGASPKVLREAYLYHLLVTANRSYFLARSSGQQASSLSPVYTPLMSDLVEPGKRADRQSAETPRLSAVEALAHHRHLCLLGGPGSGKSSLAHMLAVSMAGELLGQPPGQPCLAHLLAPVPKDALANALLAHSNEKPSAQHWPHGPLLPVLVVLRELATHLPPPDAHVGAQTLMGHIQRRLDPALQRFANQLQDELMTHGGLVILDGLDEVPEAQERRAQLRAIIEDFRNLYRHCRILVTSRPLAYQRPEWQLQGFEVGQLQRFHQGQMAHFAEAWFAQLHAQGLRSEAQAKTGAQHLVAEIQRNPRVRELAAEPLLLTLMAKLQTERGGELPTLRHQLYNDAVNLLLGDWEGFKRKQQDAMGDAADEPSLSEWLKTDRPSLRQGLEKLAFEVHAQQALMGDASDDEAPPCADISGDALTLALIKAAGRQDVKPEELKAYLKLRAGLLAEVEDNIYRLPHRSFQEYMAACHLGRSGEFAEELTQLGLAEPNRWREVLRLAAANVREQPAMIWPLVAELLHAHDEASDAERSAWAVLLAGDVLAETTLQNTPKRHQRDRDRLPGLMLGLLGDAALPAAQRVQLGQHLDLLGDPRPEIMSLDAMRFALLAPGTVWLGDERWEESSPEHPHTISYPFALAEFPLSTAQWREFVTASGHTPEDPDSLTGPSNQPAVWISWHEARALCAYLNTRWQSWLPQGWHVDLPTEAEWEFGARGAEQVALRTLWVTADSLKAQLASPAAPHMQPNPHPRRRFPWAEADFAEAANIALSLRRSSLGCFPLGASATGLQDMVGNVWEWTRSLWGQDFSKPAFPYPYGQHLPERDKLEASPEVMRVVRGGAFNFARGLARCGYRFRSPRVDPNHYLGFRLVLRSSPV